MRTQPINEHEEALLKYLQQLKELLESCQRPGMQREDLTRLTNLLESGGFYDPVPLPPGFKKMTDRQCYVNAARLAMFEDLHATPDERLVYVEGYATSIIATGHAWITKSLSGSVAIDPTWNRRKDKTPRGLAYFGIPIEHLTLRRKLGSTGVYGSHWT